VNIYFYLNDFDSDKKNQNQKLGCDM